MRKQSEVLTGPGRRLNEWINANWTDRVTIPHKEVAKRMGLRSVNIISQWRTGHARIALDRLPALADLMGVDLAFLLPLWFEQYVGDRERNPDTEEDMARIAAIFSRIVTNAEARVIHALREVSGDAPVDLTPQQIEAIRDIAVTRT